MDKEALYCRDEVWSGVESHLADDQQCKCKQDFLELSDEQPKGDFHAHSHEEEPHKQVLEWCNVALHLHHEFRLC